MYLGLCNKTEFNKNYYTIQLNLQPKTEQRLRKILKQYNNQEVFAQNIILCSYSEDDFLFHIKNHELGS